MILKQKNTLIMAVTNDLVTDNRVHKIALSLKSMGYNVTLVGRTYPSKKQIDIRSYKTHRFSLLFNKGPFFYANYNFRLFLYLLIKRYDVVVSNDLDTLPASYLATRLKRKQIVYDSHEYFTEVPELVNRPTTKQIWELIEKIIVPKLNHCYTVCQSIATIYTEKYKVPFKVVRNVPYRIEIKNEDEVITPPFSLNNPVIIYQGAVNLGRGIEEAILAMHLLDDVTLAIIGGGDHLGLCEKLVNNEGLSSKVVITGRMPFCQLQNITRYATIGLSIEKDLGLNYRYALPNKLFDYIQSEIPVLASQLPEIAKIVDKYQIGKTISDITPENIAKNINAMLKSPQDMASWKKNCSIAKEELCWENEQKALFDIFAKLM